MAPTNNNAYDNDDGEEQFYSSTFFGLETQDEVSDEEGRRILFCDLWIIGRAVSLVINHLLNHNLFRFETRIRSANSA